LPRGRLRLSNPSGAPGQGVGRGHPGAPKRVLLVAGKDGVEAAARVLGESFRDMVDEEGLSTERDLNYEQCPACGHAVAEDRDEFSECGLFIGSG